MQRIAIVWVFIMGSMACDSSYPEEPTGIEIRGVVTYVGTAHRNLERPAIGVFAFASWPPGGPFHASWVHEIDDPDDLNSFPQAGFSYVLRYLTPYDYHIIATITDLEDPNGSFWAAGGYPDFCSFGTTTVSLDGPTSATGVNIELFDEGGYDDPCGDLPDTIHPEPGRASVAADFVGPDLGYEVLPTDSLILALFATWPPSGAPAVVKQVKGVKALIPALVVINSVPPGSYSIFGCMDAGANSPDCSAMGDISVLVDNGASFDFVEGEAIEVEMNLTTGIGQVK